jgi:dienelactone hydrolase
MLKALLALLVIVCGAESAWAQAADPSAALIARAQDVVDRLVSGDVEPLMSMLTDKMKGAIDAGGLRRLMPGLAAQYGAFKSRTGARYELQGVMHVVYVACEFERAAVEIRVAFNPQDQIGGLGYLPLKSTVAYSPPGYVTPSAFREQAVTIDAGGWPLPGTITMPIGDGPFPAVVLVHGSGPNDRDETVGPNKPFRDLAEGLATRGIAVLRYDKRTRVHSGRAASSTSFTVNDEVVDDAIAAIKMLRATAGIRADRVFLLGHSLGGMLAPRIAAADPSIAGLILLAGPATPLEQAIVNQTRYLSMLDGTISADEQRALDAAIKLAADVKAAKPGDATLLSGPISAPASYWIDLREYDPPAAASRLEQPMLVLQGERDYQVTMDDFAAWRRAIGSRANVQLKSYPALNHLFIAGSGPSTPVEYQRPGHVEEAVVADIAGWIKK